MILASGLLFACLFSLPARGSDSPDSAALRRVTEILRDNKSKTAQELAEQLVALGAGDVPALFEIYRSGTGGLAKPATDARVLALNEVQQAATLLALKRMTLPWHSLFEAMAPVERERAARWAAVHVIGEIGEAADVHLLLDLARPQPARPGAPAPADQVAGEDPSVIGDADAAEFEADVEHIIGRDAASLAQLEQQFFSTDAQLQPLLVQAISNAHSLAAVALLSHLLGVQKELDLTLVTGIAKCAAGLVPPFDEHIDEAVRACLNSSSEDLVREAALTAGKLEDADSIPMLVTLLAHANRGVRENAYWSLQRISGLSFSSDAQSWGAWLKVEESWWRESAPTLFAKLESAPKPQALEIVQEIARRRYPRHPLALELSRALSHKEAEVRRLTCVALGQFRSRTALPGLLKCLDDADPDVRVAAERALRTVTGANLPPIRAAWTQAGY